MKFLPLLFLTSLSLQATPLISSWFTDLSGRYARIYPDNDAMAAQASVTTWNRGAGIQADPAYAGITEISSTATDVYIRTSNLGLHVMGPWYGRNGNLFPNYPANQADIYRFSRTPAIPTTKTGTGLGVIGYMVDGIALFDSRDAFSYDTSQAVDDGPGAGGAVNGDDIWNRDAYINESDTFDNAFAHQAGANQHYHANSPAIRHFLDDSVDYDPATNIYTENPNGAHSPIIGWFRDGLPLYGPYGYSDSNDATSTVRRMISGYQKRDGSNGSTDLAATGRTTHPQWIVRNDGTSATIAAAFHGPNVSAAIPIGHYLEDYAYKGDLGLTPGVDFDLNEYNVRFCVTPEFPAGTWAYFTNIEPDGTPAYPYNIARYYYGTPSGTSPNTVPAEAIIHFEGGPKKATVIHTISETNTDEVTLVWSAIEGGQYTIDSSTTLEVGSWTREANDAGPIQEKLTLANNAAADPKKFYRTKLNSLEPFDQNGIQNFSFNPGVVHLFHFATSPALPTEITTITVGGINGTVVAYDPINGLLEVSFDDATLNIGEYPAIINSSIASTDDYSVSGPNNVLLLIVDDWGIDASELYNTETGPGIQLANMPTLKNLADNGLLFTRGYAQPICSPTRATMLTGRQPYQHGVGNPQANSTLLASEQTFPELISTNAPTYGLASFGKWHLGSGDTGPLDTGGWPNFTGTLTGGVPDYSAWTRVKIENSILTDSGTAIADLVTSGDYTSPYATSVQVDEAASFITDQGAEPWVVWMGFNAPHTPFHDPPANLAPTGGYSTTGTANKDLYVRMLEALDTEIGRLLASVDMSKTNIIIIGDNGTPGQVDQAPAGGIAEAKGSLNEGGIHVPFFAHGPDITQTGTSDKLVHVADLFSTVLDLTGVEIPTNLDLNSTSIAPIFNGTDTADRCIIAEKFGLDPTDDGRSLIIDTWPNYKLISIQDVSDPTDTPTYQMYLLGANGVEASTLTTPPNLGDPHEAAYNALVTKDQRLELDNTVPSETVYIDLPTNCPPLINNRNGNIVRPNGITIGRVAATYDTGAITARGITTSAARVDESGAPDQFSVVANFDVSTSGLTSGQSYDIIVSFPGAGGNRTFTATNQYLVP
ncbi:MAG: sulfatase-like hydrolase/transferase [Akkermansiaceae bacterium]|nr:sulfatase-like hydrolase/transferase [Akkermansiaceae bacterium]